MGCWLLKQQLNLLHHISGLCTILRFEAMFLLMDTKVISGSSAAVDVLVHASLCTVLFAGTRTGCLNIEEICSVVLRLACVAEVSAAGGGGTQDWLLFIDLSDI